MKGHFFELHSIRCHGLCPWLDAVLARGVAIGPRATGKWPSSARSLDRQGSASLVSKARKVLDLYHRLDKEIERVQKSTGLCCREGCGHCCQSIQVETTVLEMIPLALDLHNRGVLNNYLGLTRGAGLSAPCIFYVHEEQSPDKGRCAIYPLRPLICRLFGFAARLDKQGKKLLVTCAVIKQLKENFERAQKKIEQGLKIPIMAESMMELTQIDFGLGVTQLPVNQAAAQALERIGLTENYSKGKMSSAISIELL